MPGNYPEESIQQDVSLFVRPADRLLDDSEPVLEVLLQRCDETKPPLATLKPQKERDLKLTMKILATFLRHLAQRLFYFPTNAVCFIILQDNIDIFHKATLTI
jgi:hypothetical protein